jgi:hypothetical protein
LLVSLLAYNKVKRVVGIKTSSTTKRLVVYHARRSHLFKI